MAVNENDMILHIPHSSAIIPTELRSQIVLPEDELANELLLMTDAFTDELFNSPDISSAICFPISRILVDVERFSDNNMEPMSKVGMGMIYTHTANGKTLKRALLPQETKNLYRYYNKHHKALEFETTTELEMNGVALIVDCHSFPSNPLPCDENQTTPRPVFCVGSDSYHTPLGLIDLAKSCLKAMGYSVEVNWPYAGTMVPGKYYRKNDKVTSIMIEVNRNLYMDEMTGLKKVSFNSIQSIIQTMLSSMKAYES
jgi:N-formylglutamate deformylase